MPYRYERNMYPPVRSWLEGFLKERHRKAQISVFDSSRESLARLIEKNNLMANLPNEWQSWDIYVDIVGLIREAQQTKLAFVECKNEKINLQHLSQCLGYSRIAQPLYSFIISPQGVSDSLRSLLITFKRLDVLEYHTIKGRIPRSIVVARWNETSNHIDIGSVITTDINLIGKQ